MRIVLKSILKTRSISRQKKNVILFTFLASFSMFQFYPHMINFLVIKSDADIQTTNFKRKK